MISRENCTYTTCRWVAAYKKPTWYHRGSIQRCLSLPPKRNREKTAVTQRVAASQNRPWWPRGPDPKAVQGPALALTLLWACSTKCTAYKNKIRLLQITNTTLQNARRTKYNYRKSQLLYKMHGLQNPTTANHKYCSTKYMNQKALDLFPPIHISTSQ